MSKQDDELWQKKLVVHWIIPLESGYKISHEI